MINKAILIGNVGKDPEIKSIGTEGNKVASFSLATTEKYKKDNTIVENTTWHNIKIWGKLAEVVEKYVKKGHKLYLEGKINNSSYEKDGETKYFSEVVADRMVMLTSKEGAENEAKQETPVMQGGKDGAVVDESDDLPF